MFNHKYLGPGLQIYLDYLFAISQVVSCQLTQCLGYGIAGSIFVICVSLVLSWVIMGINYSRNMFIRAAYHIRLCQYPSAEVKDSTLPSMSGFLLQSSLLWV
jgi:hypothetical protein